MYRPSATYRIQFNASFGFQAAKGVLPYLAELGISTIYASPIFRARKGSTHGYDVVDPNSLNPELGSIEDLDALIEAAHHSDIGWLQDFVPNHMAYDSSNFMLMDIFEKGPSSPYFTFFDVVWDHLRLNLRGKLIAPFLGKPYGQGLETGELSLQYNENGFSVKYHEHVYPIRIESYASIIAHRLDVLRSRLGEQHPDFIKTFGIINVLTDMPRDAQSFAARNAQIRLAKDLLWEFFNRNSVIHDFINENVEAFNRDVDLLDQLLLHQWFLLTFWRLATKEINYQRFFNINELISVRVEDKSVLGHTHRLVLSLLGEGKIDGLRIDHLDGLYDPAKYLLDLGEESPDAYIVVEKILHSSERLPARWPVQGTTGYEFLNSVNGLFCDASKEQALDRIYAEFAGASVDWEDLVYQKKKLIIERHMTGDLDNLAHHLKKVSTTTRDGIDLTMEGLKRAVVEFSAVFPVYRTYINSETILESDRAYVHEAIISAKAKNPEPARELAFLQKVLLLDFAEHIAEEDKGLWLSFVMRFQQFTGPLMAKGVEDSAFYVFNRLVSLNEVGANPARFGVSPDAFHVLNRERAERHPHALNATSTHDAKRGEDVRARISVLSEIPEEWNTHIQLWHQQNRQKMKLVKGEPVPDRNEEYLLYETLLGAFPFDEREYETFVRRMQRYFVKACREAKTHTSWLDPDLDYESALSQFVGEILKPSASNLFMNGFTRFQKKIAFYGIFNSLSQTLLKITSPGVPDFYQGTDLWQLDLVDPDNRRPVDFEQRRDRLRQIKEEEQSDIIGLIKRMLATAHDGRVKLFTIYRGLNARKRNRALFDAGDYIRLEVVGDKADHLIVFARRNRNRWAVIIAPRLLTSIVKPGQLPLGNPAWQANSVALLNEMPAEWYHVFTDRVLASQRGISVAEALEHFPLGLLIGGKL